MRPAKMPALFGTTQDGAYDPTSTSSRSGSTEKRPCLHGYARFVVAIDVGERLLASSFMPHRSRGR
jgi:hypothetical protein